jgi:hypothetical protein
MAPGVTRPQQRLFTVCYTVALLAGLVLAARSIMISQHAIDYEVARALSLGS